MQFYNSVPKSMCVSLTRSRIYGNCRWPQGVPVTTRSSIFHQSESNQVWKRQ